MICVQYSGIISLLGPNTVLYSFTFAVHVRYARNLSSQPFSKLVDHLFRSLTRPITMFFPATYQLHKMGGMWTICGPLVSNNKDRYNSAFIMYYWAKNGNVRGEYVTCRMECGICSIPQNWRGESFKTKRWHLQKYTNASWHLQNLSKSGNVDTENGIFQKPKR